eukprot:CAMPEP_0177572030 /NCGR_PEP_ID=MMETSP0369-20130122/77748_1 /TAXON_ID=447022 ORGANISM="Scrippsiella hangoei-like, Strain SHHI-4" /NCGR_SAMPLE_ID=MMETSP0369 /ASSEMBLY_ACC=CAM_ASM_000364 /LENGTH=93 /DNA_ID=CAMNT_0019059991 /DNA_START=153 /DNA_END=431 /DNA_ORIENTATION=+
MHLRRSSSDHGGAPCNARKHKDASTQICKHEGRHFVPTQVSKNKRCDGASNTHGINSERPSFPASKPSPRRLTGGISTVRKAAIPPWQPSADV